MLFKWYAQDETHPLITISLSPLFFSLSYSLGNSTVLCGNSQRFEQKHQSFLDLCMIDCVLVISCLVASCVAFFCVFLILSSIFVFTIAENVVAQENDEVPSDETENSEEQNMFMSALSKAYQAVVDGSIPGMDSAHDLAASYRDKYPTLKEAAEALVRYQTVKCGGSGFVWG